MQSGPQQKVADKMKELIHKWVFENFKGHADLGCDSIVVVVVCVCCCVMVGLGRIIEYELYWNLKREGVHFPSSGAHTMVGSLSVCLSD